MSTQRDKEEFVVTRKELRTLLFWASVGVRESKGGSYQHDIESVIVEWVTKLNLKIPYHLPYPEFGKAAKNRKERP